MLTINEQAIEIRKDITNQNNNTIKRNIQINSNSNIKMQYNECLILSQSQRHNNTRALRFTSVPPSEIPNPHVQHTDAKDN